jgi:hypothetical protein
VDEEWVSLKRVAAEISDRANAAARSQAGESVFATTVPGRGHSDRDPSRPVPTRKILGAALRSEQAGKMLQCMHEKDE